MFIQALDGVVQSPFRIDLLIHRQGIVNSVRPTFFLENGQYTDLVGRGQPESLHKEFAESQLAQLIVPDWDVPNGRSIA